MNRTREFARCGVSPVRLMGTTALCALIAGMAASPALAQDQQSSVTATAGNAGTQVASAQPAASSSTPGAQTDTAAAATQQESQAIVITGFRRSLNAALNIKRDSVAEVDAIVAED